MGISDRAVVELVGGFCYEEGMSRIESQAEKTKNRYAYVSLREREYLDEWVQMLFLYISDRQVRVMPC